MNGIGPSQGWTEKNSDQGGIFMFDHRPSCLITAAPPAELEGQTGAACVN